MFNRFNNWLWEKDGIVLVMLAVFMMAVVILGNM